MIFIQEYNVVIDYEKVITLVNRKGIIGLNILRI